MNSITIVGNLTKDAVTRQAGDSKVTGFSIAENRRIKGEDVTTFYDCSLWGDRGEKIAQYLTKGGQVTVTGELLPLREKDGKAYIDIRVNDVSLPVRRDGAAPAQPAYQAPAYQAPPARPPAPVAVHQDEIPF